MDAAQLTSTLQLHSVSAADFVALDRCLPLAGSRTCDYTIGGIALWAEFFNYRIASDADALYILGGREDNRAIPAFALPLTRNFPAAIASLRAWSREAGCPLWFSAVPEDSLHLFADASPRRIGQIADCWSDYLYDIRPFSTLAGGDMKKKRNHVHSFVRAHEGDFALRELTPALTPLCAALLRRLGHDDTDTGRAEFDAVERMLRRWTDFAPYFRGMALTVAGHVAGFTVGELRGDTLHVHVEKVDHAVDGANEFLASRFAATMLADNPALRFVNRQDDAGDPGLRASKLSWRPLRLLPKFNVLL